MSSEDRLRQRLRDFFRRHTLEDIQSAYEAARRQHQSDDNIDEAVEDALRRLGVWKGLIDNPLVAKCIDWGGIARELRRSEGHRRLREAVQRALREGLSESVSREIKERLSQLREDIIKFIVRRVGDVREGLRHLHAPGSVARAEARNLYYGENYSENLLYDMALRLVDSFVIEGGHIGIYVSDDQFRRSLAEFCATRLNYPLNQLRASDLGLETYERQRPHVVFVKFLLWLRDQTVQVQDARWRETLEELARRLNEAAFLIYFMPGNEREKWSTIAIPRVDLFVARWIETEERRRELEGFIHSLNEVIERIRKAAQDKKEVKRVNNAIEVIMQNYDLLCRQLLLYGMPDSYSLRNIVAILMELALRYDVSARLRWSSWLAQPSLS